MTEQEFLKQVWRPYDKITTADGVPGKVLNVCFTTKSVRVFISGAPEWVRCELIETHTTGKGSDGDDCGIIEELHNKIMKMQDTIDGLQEKNSQLADKLNMISGGELIKNVNLILSQLNEKKKRIEKVEACVSEINEIVEKFKDL